MSRHERPERKVESRIEHSQASTPSEQAAERLRADAHPVRRVQFEAPALSPPSRDVAPSQAPADAVPKASHRPVEVPPVRTALSGASTDKGVRQPTLIEARQSVSDLIDKGVFKKAEQGDTKTGERRAIADRTESGDRVREVDNRTAPVEKIKVVYADQANDPSQRVSRADFRVRKDGTIEVVNDPEKNNKKEIVIEVEREQGKTAEPTAEQQRSIDQLTGYLSNRLMKANQDGTKDGVIEDRQGLVSDRVKAELKVRPAPEANLPEPVRHQVERMRRFEGGGRGVLSPEETDSYFTPRDRVVPRAPEQSNREWSLRETVAAMINVTEAQPYEAVRNYGERGWAVGRYMLTADMIADWLADLLGDPPDPAKLEEAVKKGKISAKLAEKLKSPQFRQFLEKLKSGEQPTASEIQQLLPKEMQEKIAGDLIAKFSEQSKDGQGNVDIGKVAVAMAIGRMPSEEELARPEFKAFENAAERLHEISKARTEHPGRNLEWQDVPTGPRKEGDDYPPSKLAVKLVDRAEDVARSMNSTGWCYKGVATALASIGVNVHGASAYMAADQLARDRRFVEVSMKDLRPGDVLVHNRSASHVHGHIAVYLGNGMEASDHVQKLITGRGYGGTRVFRLKDSGTYNA
ncbi:MAG TPA: hypothetical protein V6D08_00450 [Candidatus Obscuribacterales bacterium]